VTVEELKTELEKIISSLTSSGFDDVDPVIVGKLEELIAFAEKSRIKEGKRLLENLLSAIKSAKEGESKTKSCNVRLMALDFYVRKLLTAGNDDKS